MRTTAKSVIIAFATLALASCSGDSSRRQAAQSLVEQAQSLSETHHYQEALTVLDTLDVKYRDCIDQRREGTRVRLSALSSLTRDSLASAELQLRGLQVEIDSLDPMFKKVDIEGTEGFWVDKNVYTGSEMNSTGIQVRVDEQGYCFVVANVAGRRIGLRSISYGGVATPDGQSIEIEGSEIMSVTQEPAAELLSALSEAKGKAVVTLLGSKGKAEVTLNAKQLAAIAATWQYARALQEHRAVSIKLEKLERQLAKLSDQLASQIPVPDEE